MRGKGWTNSGSFKKGRRPWNKGLRRTSGVIAWNRGLTKDTDSRVKQISTSLMGKPKRGRNRRGCVGPNKGRRWSQEYREKMSKACRLSRKTHPVWNKGLTKKTHPSLARMARTLSLSIKGRPKPFVSNRQGRRRFWYYSPAKRIRMRSRWEVAYAHFLDRKRIAWLYEGVTFVATKFSYTPDFYLFKTDRFIELKGWENNLSKEKTFALRTRWGVTIEVLHGEDLQKIGILDEHQRVVAKGRRAV